MKRAALLAAATCMAMLALPVGASAGVWHVDKAPVAFTGSGGTMLIRTTSIEADCSSNITNGEYETTTTGWIEFTYHGCRISPAVSCTTAGQPSGTIKTPKLTFHNVLLAGNKPGILITPNSEAGVFASSSCFGTVTGNGILGELKSNCGSKSSATTIYFGSAGSGPAHTQVTGNGTVYGLVGGWGNTWEEAEGAVYFAGGFEQTITCTM